MARANIAAMPRARATLLFAAILVLILVIGSIRHLDAGDAWYVVDSPILPIDARIVEPGWQFLPRLLFRVSTYPAGEARSRVELSGERAAASSEGSRVEVEAELTYTIPAEKVLFLHQGRGSDYAGDWLTGLITAKASEGLGKASYDMVLKRDPALTLSVRRALSESLSAAGLEVLDLRLVQIAGLGESSAEILRVDARPLEREIVVIGVDSFDWDLVDPLIEQGRMPNMERLVARGTRANLRTIRPILSPVIWTSVATGMRPSRHGIADFVVTDRATGALIPVTSAMRQVPALWTLASRQGIDVDVVAWWATWPAETVRGSVVTDRVAFQLFEEDLEADWKSVDPARNKGKSYPADLIDDLQGLIRAPAEVTDAEVAWFLPGGRFPASLTAAQGEFLDSFRTVIAAGETYHAIAKKQFRDRGPGLRMVYYEGPDTASHLFMRYRPPLLAGVERADMELFGGIVERYYERQDRFIGEIVELAGPDADIVIVSDHGFKSGANRPPNSDARIGKGDAAYWHTPIGVLLLAGPDIRAGLDLGAASVLDITPTVLALFGLPVARDMDGQPLTEAFDPSLQARRQVAWIDTYGGVRNQAEATRVGSGPTTEDAEVIEKLRSLGYIGDDRMTAHNNRGMMALDEGDIDGAIADFERALAGNAGSAVPMIRTNLASAYIRKGDLEKARALSQQTLSDDPRSHQALLLLGAIAIKEGNLDAARGHLSRAVDIDPTNVQALSKLGEVHQRQGDLDAALARFQKVVEIAPLSTVEYNNIGNIYRERGDLDRAMEAYREALRADAQYIGAYNNLGLCLQERGRLEEARGLYEKGLAIRPENAMLRNSLGTVLALKGDRRAALEQVVRAAESDPNWPIAQGNLATLLFEDGRFPDARTAFERWVELEPASIDARLGLALSHLMLQDREQAIAGFGEILQREPGNLKAHIALGETLLREGSLERARDHLERAARIDPRIPRVFNSLGEVYLKMGDKRKAAAAFQKSLTIQPGQEQVRKRLADTGR